jgi:hypothetical protein
MQEALQPFSEAVLNQEHVLHTFIHGWLFETLGLQQRIENSMYGRVVLKLTN